MLGAVMWFVHGFLIDATPVIAANALVFMAAAWTIARSKINAQAPAPAQSA